MFNYISHWTVPVIVGAKTWKFAATDQLSDGMNASSGLTGVRSGLCLSTLTSSTMDSLCQPETGPSTSSTLSGDSSELPHPDCSPFCRLPSRFVRSRHLRSLTSIFNLCASHLAHRHTVLIIRTRGPLSSCSATPSSHKTHQPHQSLYGR